MIRPTYVIGPHDHTGRFTWWVRRIAAGGRVLAPGPYDAPMQVIDARDQGEWTDQPGRGSASRPLQQRLADAALRVRGPARRRRAGVGPADTELVWADGDWLKEQGETGMSLPLWTEGVTENTMAADPSHAMAVRPQSAPDHGRP